MTGIAERVFREISAPLVPEPTVAIPVLDPLPGCRAILFDIYGTLFISASGDVEAEASGPRAMAARRAVEAAAGVEIDGDEVVSRLDEAIAESHASARAEGVEHPEVNILDVWRRVLDTLRRDGIAAIDADETTVTSLAVAFEARANPVWPMPGARACLEALRGAGLRLGIVSNAQFYTPALFPALLGETTDGLGFEDDLCVYSWTHRRGKPGTFLYERARDALARRGIPAQAVLHVGNDMLKDVLPASRTGFRTALFAGDRRSLRRRDDDPRVEGLVPDLVITDLATLPGCISIDRKETAER